MKLKLHLIDAFTKELFKGNPAALVTWANHVGDRRRVSGDIAELYCGRGMRLSIHS